MKFKAAEGALLWGYVDILNRLWHQNGFCGSEGAAVFSCRSALKSPAIGWGKKRVEHWSEGHE
jgi:hypothetical protein